MGYLNEVFSSHGAVNALGVRIDPVSMGTSIERIVRWARHRDKPRYVCVTGVHGVIEAQRDTALRVLLNQADMNVPDGMPMVWIGRLAGFRNMERVFGPDLMLGVCRQSSEFGLSHFFLGGNPGVAERLALTMQSSYIGLQIAGTWSPPFRPLTESEKMEVAETINRTRPDFLWIGLSTPKQERFVGELLPLLHSGVLLAVGAAFDYNTGRLKRAPRFMQVASLEWLFRLLQEPGRLGRRYLINNPKFIGLIMQQLTRIRKYAL